jgi:hypothetical protein
VKYYPIDPKHCLDQVHDSSSARWGFATTRQIMTGFAIASTVAAAHTTLAGYSPTQLPSSFPTSPSGLKVEDLS